MTVQKPRTAACAAALLISLSAGPSLAQTSQQPDSNSSGDTLETVTVTGVRASLKSSLDEKRKADRIVDSISAEDVGKLPDNNVIDALEHVTGIQVPHNAAENNQLLIRGLPDIATTLNGREIFTSTGRYVTLQDIPAELLSRVDVVKSPRADDLEGGIAGLIDVRLHRPFDFDGLEVAGTAQGTHNSLANNTNPNFSILASDRVKTSSGDWGLLADFSYRKDDYKQEILDNYISSQSIAPVTGSTGAGGTAYIPLTEGGQSIGGERERIAANVSLQWAPNNNTEIYLESFYTRYRNPNYVDFFVGLPWICANPATATVFPGTSEVKTVTGGCYDLTSNQSFVPKTDTYQIAWGGSWTGNVVTASTELDYTDSRFSQTGYILDSEYYPPANGYTTDFNYNNTGTPYINVSGVNLLDPSQYHVRQFYDQWTKQYGNEIDWRGDLTYDLDPTGMIKTIQGGVRFVDRGAKNLADNASGLDCRGTADPSSPTYAAVAAAIASPACFTALNALQGTAWHTTSGSLFNGAFGLSKWIDADPNWLINNIGYLRKLFGQSSTGAAPPADPTQSFYDREISYAGYVKADFGFNAGSLPVTGNIGLRLLDYQTTLKGITLVVSPTGSGGYSFAYSPTQANDDSLDWLPSLNARLALQDDLFLRLSASRTVTHPTFSQLNPALSLSSSTATLLGSGTSGNPDLKSEKSTNADMSLEYYYGAQNAITAAGFYRHVDGYIYSGVTPETIAGISYQVTRPVNAAAGDIEGLELAYTQFMDFLPSPFDGFGLQANGTYIAGDFANISKWSYNLTGIFEKGPVSIRLAYNWRDSFLEGAAPGGGMQPSNIYAKAQPWLDLSASYRVTDQLTATLDATNLLNSYYQDYFGDERYARDTRRFDQTIVFGVRYRL